MLGRALAESLYFKYVGPRLDIYFSMKSDVWGPPLYSPSVYVAFEKRFGELAFGTSTRI